MGTWEEGVWGRTALLEEPQQDSAYFLRTKQSMELALGQGAGRDPVPGLRWGQGREPVLRLLPWCPLPTWLLLYRARVGKRSLLTTGRSH